MTQLYSSLNITKELTVEETIAIISQRDLSRELTINITPYVGVNVSNPEIISTKDDLIQKLDGGYSILYLDIFWNDSSRNWQLANEQYLDLDDFFDAVNMYLKDSNYEIAKNSIILIFKLQQDSINLNINRRIKNLSTKLRSIFDYRLYSIDDYRRVDFYEYPTVDTFLFEDDKRVIPIVLSNATSSDYVFVNTSLIDWNIILYDGTNISEFTEIYERDHSIIINNPSINWTEVIVNTIWTWRTDQPFSSRYLKELLQNELLSDVFDYIYNSDDFVNDLNEDNGYIDNSANGNGNGNGSNSTVAYNCTISTDFGWFVDNCYNKHHVLCGKNISSLDNNDIDWRVSESKVSYFNCNEQCEIEFGEEYKNLVPRLPSQQKYIKENLSYKWIHNDTTTTNTTNITTTSNSDDSGYSYFNESGNRIKYYEQFENSFWVDFNSLDVEDCWVRGGAKAKCPYFLDEIKDNRNFNLMMSIFSIVLGFVIGLLIFIIKMQKHLPIQNNRKRWKKTISKYSENEYEGVPA
ncbi:Mtc6p ASCRUDRAFT_5709 [Ascoidea rubescens DSM 1968]|uniref:Maintenance of telomere capping protein 6 n=1 Tax=Ascoidea rubescens DSM 1968 TaxID=1344418 RepID=A0A1D2VQ83_9ASCO|nr:hypothetical protein ASCRUDRAFT_5709 [Ascoidea rubescens DSM 1968]ODV63771.1 hypothetical protein ASCRUDRAFT_5709 [Ascoidea rubescens DSM 1968]